MELYGAYIIIDNAIVWTYLGNSRIVCQNKLLDRLEVMGKRTVVLPALNYDAIFINSTTSYQLFKYVIE